MYVRFSKAEKDKIKENLKVYFEQERSEEIGDLAAENLFDFLVKEVGPYFYNQGIKDAKEMVEQKVMNLEEDLQSLERPL
ncbi:DUF2164 domain-containing protein [Oceanobacillus halotolerans]|uniref:DUF2164 domain-containing protein n=1 Tax=Oceanobacillus halotolerans TaxID=2663380 RepID=UPI0013D950C0|nr:DUF2164 domain-containing protein [Oceanobacillus halotolerans]